MADNFFKTRNGIALGALSSAPSNPKNGDFYYNTTLDQFLGYQNGTWVTFGGATTISENTQTGTTYTFALTDAGKLVSFTNVSSVNVTLPTNASVAFPIGSVIEVISGGAGGVSIIPVSGVTIKSLNGNNKLTGQYAEAKLIKSATDTWYLYGDLASSFITATGGTITTDGNFKVHTFTSSGTFTITSAPLSPTVRALVVAGGGSGGGNNVGTYGSGGGGAGGMQDVSSIAVSVGSYAITVGAGGAGVLGNSDGVNGGNSSFGGLVVCTGGGGGGRANSTLGTPGNGGSGGGGGSYVNLGQSGGTGTSGQGNNGGTSPTGFSNNSGGAGGGGAGSVGANAASSGGNGASGGNGLTSNITGTSLSYAAGGGGGAGTGSGGAGGSSGVGGSGGSGVLGSTPSANTGSGSGGAGSAGGGASVTAADGIVIIRYQFQ